MKKILKNIMIYFINNFFTQNYKNKILKCFITNVKVKPPFTLYFFFLTYFDYWLQNIYLKELDPDKRFIMQKNCLGGFDGGVKYAEAEYAVDFIVQDGYIENKFTEIFDNINLILNENKNKKITVLQIGSSNGRKIKYIAEHDKNIKAIGIDIYDEVVNYCNENNYSKNLTFYNCPLHNINSILEKIDYEVLILFSSGSSEYIQPEHLKIFFEKIKNKKNTYIFFSEGYFTKLINDKSKLVFSDKSFYNGGMHYTHRYDLYAKEAGFVVDHMIIHKNNSCFFSTRTFSDSSKT